MAGKPRSAVFTTVLWNGASKIADLDEHLARLIRHAKRLRINLPKDTRRRLASKLNELTDKTLQTQLLNITYNVADRDFVITPRRLPKLRNCELHAMTMPMKGWLGEVTGTKHGDWQMYLDAKTEAQENGADIALFVDEYSIIDSDRASLIVIDDDGVAYVTNSAKSVHGVTLQILIDGLNHMGVPLSYAKLNERLVARCSEVIAVGVGVGCCRILTIDGEKVGSDNAVIYPVFLNYLAQHYSNSNNWIALCD